MRHLREMLGPLFVGILFLVGNTSRAQATTLVSLVPLLEGRQITGGGLFDVGRAKTINVHISVQGVRPWLIPSLSAITADANHIFVPNGHSERVWVLALVSLPSPAITIANSGLAPIAGIPLVTPASTAAAPTGVMSAASVSTLAASAVSAASADVSQQDDPVVTPEASSILYLGSAILTGGILLKRRRSWSSSF